MTTEVHANDEMLRDAPLLRLFLRYSLPTITAMLVTGIYVAVDGMFIGHFVGEKGLAAIMLAYPIGSVLYALGNLVGMGAASLVSINLGQGKPKLAQHIVGNTLSLSLIFSVLISIVGITYSENVILALGAEGRVADMAVTYLRWYFGMGVFALVSMAFSILLRNDGEPNRVTFIMILGGVLNIFLDWVFIVLIPWELKGAAIATMLSQAVTAVLCLHHFFKPTTRLHFTLTSIVIRVKTVVDIFQLGIPGFLIYLYLSVVLTFHNMAFLASGAPINVAAYAVVSYTEAFFYLAFEGIALGMQPITSFNLGAGKIERVKTSRNIAFSATMIVAALGLFIVYGFPETIIYAFAGDRPDLAYVTKEGMHLYFWGLPMEGLLLVGAIYFQSINQANIANWLTGGKLVIIAAMLYSLTKLFGTTGTWVSLACTSTLLNIWMFWKLYQTRFVTVS
ncbi:MATE family efflux transporter [Grimontia sp. NTOU-MAR1]|uniref:MATE family efflux transporter n=1 Tax=Grimontia sp. NTOU-MAR1 TaxID=3111011 RepID=UPI002DBAC881|nr:MATE family efflux transporter [Grimontia sp. NTOU-MAR1]WRW00104.1 MATE family efflux transporter [Grimontia sp. NTOU-MAR1]